MSCKQTYLIPSATIRAEHRNRMHHSPCRARCGFALVSTLSLMILLTVIAVGMLTLSSITSAKSVKRLMIVGNKWLSGPVKVRTEACTDVINEDKIQEMRMLVE